MVEQSRRACSAVANGEADCAIIGGDVPDELAHVLKVCSGPPEPWAPCSGGALPHHSAAGSDLDELTAVRASETMSASSATSVPRAS